MNGWDLSHRQGDEIPFPRNRKGRGGELAWCCVYAIGPENGYPLKIGYAVDPLKALSKLRAENRNAVRICLTFWVGDSGVARRLQKACRELLDKANKRRSDGWFDINSEWAEKVVRFAANRESIPLYSNSDLNKIAAARTSRHRLNYPHRDEFGTWKSWQVPTPRPWDYVKDRQLVLRNLPNDHHGTGAVAATNAATNAHVISTKKLTRTQKNRSRNYEIARMRSEGASLMDIARNFRLSKPRVWQILNALNA
jgi:DNA-binding CsgD family transcriptional regulator